MEQQNFESQNYDDILEQKVFKEILGALNDMNPQFISREEFEQKDKLLTPNNNWWRDLWLPNDLQVSELPKLMRQVNETTFWSDMPAFASTEELQVKIAITVEELNKKLQDLWLTSEDKQDLEEAIDEYERLYADITSPEEALKLSNPEYRWEIITSNKTTEIRRYYDAIKQRIHQNTKEGLEYLLDDVQTLNANEISDHFEEAFLEDASENLRNMSNFTQDDFDSMQDRKGDHKNKIIERVQKENLESWEKLLRDTIWIPWVDNDLLVNMLTSWEKIDKNKLAQIIGLPIDDAIDIDWLKGVVSIDNNFEIDLLGVKEGEYIKRINNILLIDEKEFRSIAEKRPLDQKALLTYLWVSEGSVDRYKIDEDKLDDAISFFNTDPKKLRESILVTQVREHHLKKAISEDPMRKWYVLWSLWIEDNRYDHYSLNQNLLRESIVSWKIDQEKLNQAVIKYDIDNVKLQESLWVGGMDWWKKQLEITRLNWDTEKVTEMELWFTNALISEFNKYPYQALHTMNAFSPSTVVDEKTAQCVGFSLMWHAFLQEAWIEHKWMVWSKHATLQVIIWWKDYLFDPANSDKLHEISYGKQQWKYTQMSAEWLTEFQASVWDVEDVMMSHLANNIWNRSKDEDLWTELLGKSIDFFEANSTAAKNYATWLKQWNIEELNKFIKDFPWESTDWLYWISYNLLYRWETEKADVILNKLLSEQPNDSRVYRLKSKITTWDISDLYEFTSKLLANKVDKLWFLEKYDTQKLQLIDFAKNKDYNWLRDYLLSLEK